MALTKAQVEALLASRKGKLVPTQRTWESSKVESVKAGGRLKGEVAKRDNRRKDQRRSGAAMTASGAVIGGTGLVAGGIPGAPEPKTLDIWNIRGGKKNAPKEWTASDPRQRKSRLSPTNLPYNARRVLPQARAGILGFRANMHDEYIKDAPNKKPTRNAFVQGNRAGKLEAEHKIVRGMRIARRATYPLTIGGGALALAGHRRTKNSAVKKADRRGSAGAVVGGTGGAYLGVRYGGDLGRAVVNRKISREWLKETGSPVPKGKTVVGGDRFVRRAKAVTRGTKGGVLLGAVGGSAGGYKLLEKRDKQRNKVAEASATALGGGATMAGVAHVAPKGLDRFSRKYQASAKQHILEAQKLAPHYGGLKVKPGKINEYGVQVRKPKTTIYPAIDDKDLVGAERKIKGGREARAAVGRHRGIATQERHFVEAFDGTSRVLRRLRGPALGVAAAGAAGLAGSSASEGYQNHRRRQRVSKAYGYQEERTSPLRVVEAGVGLSLLGWGGSRLGVVRGTLKAGSKKAGNLGIASRRAEKARNTVEVITGRGAAMLGKQTTSNVRLRPIEAAAGGALITNHAIPVRRKSFHAAQPPQYGPPPQSRSLPAMYLQHGGY